MIENSIDTKIAKIELDFIYRCNSSDIRNIVSELTGLVVMGNDSLEYGEAFEEFCGKLCEDEEALNNIKTRLSKIYN